MRRLIWRRILWHRLICVILLLVLDFATTYAQGCSDAGFCSMNGLKPLGISRFKLQDSIDSRHSLKLGTSFGLADYAIVIFGNYLEYAHRFPQNLQLNARIITLGHAGNGIKVWNLGDILLSGTYQLKSIKLSLGLKMPLNTGNVMYKNMPLPMDYQASLGTYDLILGFAYQYRKLSINAGLQYPLKQNSNSYFHNSNISSISHIPPTNAFKRAPDILLRLSYPFALGSRFSLSPSILPIYHVHNDEYTDANNKSQEIPGSRGLTLNLNLFLDYKLSAKQNLQLSLGAPALFRKARPDGLTRHFLGNLEYSFTF